MLAQLLLRPAANCTDSLLDLDFFFRFSLLQIASPKNLVALYTLGHSQALSVGYSYSVQFVDYFVGSSDLLSGELRLVSLGERRSW